MMIEKSADDVDQRMWLVDTFYYRPHVLPLPSSERGGKVST
jgi:hypothetical protein